MTRTRIQESLPLDWALIDFWRTAGEEFTAFVLVRDGLHIEKLPFHAGKLRPLLELIRETRHDPQQLGRHVEILHDVHQYLFRPLLPLLRLAANRGALCRAARFPTSSAVACGPQQRRRTLPLR